MKWTLLLMAVIGCRNFIPANNSDTSVAECTDACADNEHCVAGACECVEGFSDCDDEPGCETDGCCNPVDEYGNPLTDCDLDGICECYGVCMDGVCEGE